MAGKTLDTLNVVLTGSAKGVVAAFKEGGKAAVAFSKAVAGIGKGAQESLNKLGDKFKNIVAPIAAAAGAFASFKAVMESFERADSLGRTSTALGITTTSLQKLQYAASQSGSSASEMDAALSKMSKFLGEADVAGGEAEKTLKRLGLSQKDFIGLNADDAFAKMADKLKSVDNQSEKTSLGMKVFGENAGKLALVIDGGEEGLKALGDEGERTGRVMSAMDFSKLMAAKESMEKLGSAFQALSDRIAIAFAPVFDWVSKEINAWIGDTKSFDDTFNAMAKGVVIAIGLIKMVWQGLTLLWEGAKVIVGGLSVAFWETAKAIVKAAMWISDLTGKVWDNIAAAFGVTKNVLVTAFYWVKDKAIGAFSDIGIAFGKMIIGIGRAAASSGIKGIANIGRDAEDAGAALLIGATKLAAGTKAELTAAQKALEASQVALEDTQEAFNKPANTSTPYLDQMAANAHSFANAAIKDFKRVAQAIADQEGGNAISQALADFEKSQAEMAKRSAEIVKQANATRVLATQKTAEEEAAIWLKSHEKMLGEYTSFIDAINKKTADKRGSIGGDKAGGEYSEQMAKLEEFNKQSLGTIADYEQKKSEITALYGLNRVEQDYARSKERLEVQAKSGNDSFAQQFAQIEAQKALDEETYAARIEAFNKFAEVNNLSVEEKNAGLAELEQKNRDATVENDRATNQLRTQAFQEGTAAIGDAFGNLATLMQSKNKQLFQIGKAAALAQNVVQTISSAASSFDAGAKLGGPILGGVFAATAVAAGLLRAQQLMAAKPPDSSGGGSVPSSAGGGAAGGAGAAAQAAQNRASSSSNITLVGSSFSSNQVRGLIGALNDQLGDNMSLSVQVQG